MQASVRLLGKAISFNVKNVRPGCMSGVSTLFVKNQAFFSAEITDKHTETIKGIETSESLDHKVDKKKLLNKSNTIPDKEFDNLYNQEFLKSGVLYYFWQNEEKINAFVEKIRKKVSKDLENKYIIFFDGASKGNPGLSGAGFVLYNYEGKKLGEFSAFIGYSITNNQAEYAGLIIGQLVTRMIGIKNLHVYGDSKLIINQMNGSFKVATKTLFKVNEQARLISKHFDSLVLTHIKRDLNLVADKVANKALTEYLRDKKLKKEAEENLEKSDHDDIKNT